MQFKKLIPFVLLILSAHLFAQVNTTSDTIPLIEYSSAAPKYEIAGITVTGAANYEDFVLIGFSG